MMPTWPPSVFFCAATHFRRVKGMGPVGMQNSTDVVAMCNFWTGGRQDPAILASQAAAKLTRHKSELPRQATEPPAQGLWGATT